MTKGFRVRLHPAGAVMWGVLFCFFPSHWALALAAALLWHEGAHLAVMRLCGVKSCHVELTPFGGMMDAENLERLSPIRQALCAASGVLASLAGAWLCERLNLSTRFWQQLKQFHLSLAVVNCLPVWPLDGARVCVACAMCLGWENSLRKWLRRLSQLLGISMTALGLYGAWQGMLNPSLLLCGPYLCYAASMGSAADRLRMLERSRSKLNGCTLLPLRAYASADAQIERRFPQLLGRMAGERYHLLVQLDGTKIRRVWTEAEMLENTLQMEGIDALRK